MIVEIFIKGSNFKKLHDTLWNVKKIERSGHYFVVTFEEDAEKESVFLDCEKFEMRVCY